MSWLDRLGAPFGVGPVARSEATDNAARSLAEAYGAGSDLDDFLARFAHPAGGPSAAPSTDRMIPESRSARMADPWHRPLARRSGRLRPPRLSAPPGGTR